MATQVQFRRGTTTQNNAFTGAIGEITYDNEVKTLRLHDGSTAGGGSVVTINAGTQTLTNKTMSTNSVWQGTAVGLAYGGTNANITAAAGAVVYSTSSALGVTAAGTSGQVLTSSGASSPTWTAQSSLVVGTATVATTATNIAGGSAGNLIIQLDTNQTTFVAAGAAGTFLKSTGASTAPEFAAGEITIGSTATAFGSTSTSLVGVRSITMGNGSHGGATVGTITGTGPWTATLTGISSTTGIMVGQNITATAGTGSLFGGSPTSVLVASIVSGTSITVTVTGGTTPTAGTITSITTFGFLQVPTGTTDQRPWIPANGMIRYNSTQSSFEGYASGAWSSLGGVKSVDGFTFIQAETSAGNGNGDLDFYAEDNSGSASTQVGQWNKTNLKDYTGTLVGTQTTQNVFNATATTVNAFGAATALTIGATTGTSTVRNNLTVTGNLTVNGTTTTVNSTTVEIQNAFVFEGATADAFETTLSTVDPTADRTILLPDASDTLVGKATTDTLTNKSISLTNNTVTFTSLELKTACSDETGSGALVFATSPTLVTPTLGVATATSINKVAFTAPATGSTLTIADGKTLTASNSLTFTGTDASSVAFGAGGTVAYTANKLSVFAATTSTELAGIISDETGSGALVFANTPTLVTPDIGAATGTSLNLTNINLESNGNATIAGSLAANGGITVDSTAFVVANTTGNTSIAGTLGVTGVTTLTGLVNANGGIAVDTNAFTVADTTGNTAIAGTLNVTGTTTLGNLTIGSTKTIDVGANKVTNVAEPTAATDAATKQYVDTIAASSLHYHSPVRVESPTALTATYANGTAGVGATLTNSGAQAALVIDGITLNADDRVLIYTQANAAHNGVYTVTTVGSGSTNWVLTRATDADNASVGDPNGLGAGDAFYVKEGNTGAGELYVMNTTGTITVGTTAINFTQISSAQIYSAGTGLTLTGTQYSVNASQTQITAVGTLTSGTWNASVISGEYGGTGVANTGKTITLGGNLTTSGAHATTLTTTGTTGVTLPTTGTLATLSGTETLANKTLTTPNIGAATGTSLTTTGGGLLARAAATQDGIEIRGRAGGTGNWEVILTPTTLTADRTLTFADVSGTVVTTGDTGSVTSTMIADGTIVNADINASAAIAVSKLAASTISGITLGSNLATLTIGTGLSGTSYNGSGAVTIANTGVTSVSAGTGITLGATTGACSISIGQAVATSSNVQFNSIGVNTGGSGTAGEIRATNNITAYYSDSRLKDFAGTIPNALDKVLALNGYYFTENAKAKELGYNNDARQVGVSAQEVETVLPEVIADAPINGNFPGADYKTVHYEKLVPLLIEAIKEQQKQIEELKAKLGN
jgi:hypothetical protein